jgi:hypothetical protein
VRTHPAPRSPQQLQYYFPGPVVPPVGWATSDLHDNHRAAGSGNTIPDDRNG